MLVLSRKPGERILIGDDIVVTVVRFQGGTVRLGIEAPRDFAVIREELGQAMTDPPATFGEKPVAANQGTTTKEGAPANPGTLRKTRAGQKRSR